MKANDPLTFECRPDLYWPREHFTYLSPHNLNNALRMRACPAEGRGISSFRHHFPAYLTPRCPFCNCPGGAEVVAFYRHDGRQGPVFATDVHAVWAAVGENAAAHFAVVAGRIGRWAEDSAFEGAGESSGPGGQSWASIANSQLACILDGRPLTYSLRGLVRRRIGLPDGYPFRLVHDDFVDVNARGYQEYSARDAGIILCVLLGVRGCPLDFATWWAMPYYHHAARLQREVLEAEAEKLRLAQAKPAVSEHLRRAALAEPISDDWARQVSLLLTAGLSPEEAAADLARRVSTYVDGAYRALERELIARRILPLLRVGTGTESIAPDVIADALEKEFLAAPVAPSVVGKSIAVADEDIA